MRSFAYDDETISRGAFRARVRWPDNDISSIQIFNLVAL